MEAAEGKLFRPLAYTKTFALIGSIVVALTIIPPLAHWFIAGRYKSHLARYGLWSSIALAGVLGAILLSWFPWWLGLFMIVAAAFHLSSPKIPNTVQRGILFSFNFVVAVLVALWLAADWKPLGPEEHIHNILFVLLTVGGLLGFFYFFYQVLRTDACGPASIQDYLHRFQWFDRCLRVYCLGRLEQCLWVAAGRYSKFQALRYHGARRAGSGQGVYARSGRGFLSAHADDDAARFYW